MITLPKSTAEPKRLSRGTRRWSWPLVRKPLNKAIPPEPLDATKQNPLPFGWVRAGFLRSVSEAPSGATEHSAGREPWVCEFTKSNLRERWQKADERRQDNNLEHRVSLEPRGQGNKRPTPARRS